MRRTRPVRNSRNIARSFNDRRKIPSLFLQQVLRNFGSVGGELSHHFLVQPHVHRGRVVGIAIVVQVLRELLAGGEAAIHPDELHQIYNRTFPVEFLGVLRSELVEHGCEIDG